MNIKKFFQILIHSFYSKSLYRNVCYKWQGYVIKYQLYLSIFISLIAVIYFSLFMERIDINFLKNEELVNDNNEYKPNNITIVTKTVIEQIPDINFKNGVAEINSEEAIKIYNPLNDKLFLIIDTNVEDISQEFKDSPEAFIFIDKNKINFKIPGKQENIHYSYYLKDLFGDKDQIITKEDIKDKFIMIIDNIKWLLPILIFGLQVTVNFFYNMGKIFIFTTIIFFYFNMSKKKKDFKQLFRLVNIASSLSIVLTPFLGILADLNILSINISYLLINVTYMAIILFAIKMSFYNNDFLLKN